MQLNLVAPGFAFTVPGHPQPKERPRLVKRRRPVAGKPGVVAITPPKTRAYESNVAAYCAAAVPAGWLSVANDNAEYELEVHVYRDTKRGDLDNVVKALSDGMNGLAWPDDSAVSEIHAYRYTDKNNPRVDVFVTRKVS